MIPQKVAHRPGSGGSDKFLQFITHELNPFIETRYPTSTFTLLYGGSNAGLFVVYSLLDSQEVIEAGIASSPMIGHCSDFMFSHMERLAQGDRMSERTLYMVYGANDSKRVVDHVPRFIDTIKNKKSKKLHTKMVILENEGHVPPTSLRLGLLAIFKR
jgi:predicted alpha/beta superfamily hydrolase